MKVTADTNVLLRAVIQDETIQSRIAAEELRSAEMVALPITTLCEFVSILSRCYQTPSAEIAGVVRTLLAAKSVVVNRPAAEAGLAQLEAGGHFADGVIADEGRWLGTDTFVSFDAGAIRRLRARGEPARLLG